MANGTSFVDSQIQNVNELQLDWLQFSRHVFHFQKSLQLQQNYMGGSPTYFKSVQDVSAFCYGYLAADSSERIVVENWLDLHKKVSSCVMEMMSQLSAEERSQMAAQAKELRDMCDDSLSSVHLARLNHLPLTEMERRCMGGIINLADKSRIQSHMGKLPSAWLNALPIANLGLKLTNNQLRTAVATRLSAKVCEPRTCRCGLTVDTDGRHGLYCRKSAGRHARHSSLNDLVKRTLASLDIPAVLEPPGLITTNRKIPDGMTPIPSFRGQLVPWDATVVDALAPGWLSHFEPLKAASDAEVLKPLPR